MAHKLTYTHPSSEISVSVEVHEDANINTMIDAFEQYMKACGYQFDGELSYTERDNTSCIVYGSTVRSKGML